jgi:acyl-[acyl-carrier-protein]-phospholipid O-acyltransferase/long-chain-fatty-acid--[acyl-carrier-protein] ligase
MLKYFLINLRQDNTKQEIISMSGTKWIPLFSTNFLGVFNNNYFKLLIITISVAWFPKDSGVDSYIVSLASGLFFVPYILFSPLAGKLAQIMFKKKLILYSRIAEFPIYTVGAFGFYIENIYVVLGCIFLLGVISTLFSPAKYGLIRDIGGNKGISFGTGVMEMLVFFGNIVGPVVASIISDHYNYHLLASILIGVAVLSFVTTLLIKASETEPLKNSSETINPILFLVNSFKWVKGFKGMNLIVLGLGSFWMIDGMLQMNLIIHCPGILKLSNTEMSIVMSIALIGIGLGSLSSGLISKGKVELLLTPIGGLGMTLFLILVYTFQPANVYIFCVFIFFIAMFSGIFMVHLSAYIQTKIEGRKQGDMIAYSNFITFLMLFIGSGLFGLISGMFGTNSVFLFLLIVVVLITFLLVKFVPEMNARVKSFLTIK